MHVLGQTQGKLYAPFSSITPCGCKHRHNFLEVMEYLEKTLTLPEKWSTYAEQVSREKQSTYAKQRDDKSEGFQEEALGMERPLKVQNRPFQQKHDA